MSRYPQFHFDIRYMIPLSFSTVNGVLFIVRGRWPDSVFILLFVSVPLIPHIYSHVSRLVMSFLLANSVVSLIAPPIPPLLLWTTLLAFPTSGSAACFFSSSILTASKAFSWVACKWTFGTIACAAASEDDWAWSRASFQREAQRHHLQPALRPMLRRLLPRDAVKSRKASVSVARGYISWAFE